VAAREQGSRGKGRRTAGGGRAGHRGGGRAEVGGRAGHSRTGAAARVCVVPETRVPDGF
jgi:hypothetical protein